MRQITKRLDELREKIELPGFFDNKGLGNEVGFYIFDYDPTDELVVREAIPQMRDYLERTQSRYKIQIFDMYDIILSFFEKRGYMEKNFKMEEKKGSLDWYEKMQKALKLATNNDYIVSYICDHIEDNAIIFITGIGKAYPVVRSHVILNNLQAVIEDNPLILFFPGMYDDGKLKLFGKFEDDHYYRAFKIIEK